MDNFFISHSYLTPLLPLVSFLILGLVIGGKNRRASTLVALTLSLLSMLSAFGVAWAYFRTVLKHPETYPDKTIIAFDYQWLNFTPDLTAHIGAYLDPISVMMLLVITVIAFLVSIYSVGYMHDDPGFGRFFALLNLFAFSMLGLVLSTNLIQIFVFWELVGVSSYSLIGFWYEKPSAVAASKKAFIVTRFADAFFLTGIITVATLAGSFDFLTLNSPQTADQLNQSTLIFGMDVNLLALAGLLIFAGGWGKSAMFPLHIWLPDAMEGPTPVSSIIHSATMVVAGVYLTARMLPLFAASHVVLETVRIVGVFTALFAGVIALTQKDIKRILAFSTLSQLGYMMFALGAVQMAGDHAELGQNILGYSSSMFHVFTHAFFKCLLFLGAGAIIHAVHSNDIEDMGGLKTVMPWTYWSLLAACLAIAGVPPLSGFWSKDAILLTALQSGHYVTFATGLVVGGITALYMFRFFFLIFHGPSTPAKLSIKEDPWMTVPIVILAIPSLLIGYFSKDFFFNQFQIPMFTGDHHGHHPAWLPMVASAMGIAGVILAWIFYGQGKVQLAEKLRERLSFLHRLTFNKFYIDEIYLFITKKIIFGLVAAPIKWFDRNVVDGLMNATAWILQAGGTLVRLIQNGQLTFYLGGAALGLIFLYMFGGLPL